MLTQCMIIFCLIVCIVEQNLKLRLRLTFPLWPHKALISISYANKISPLFCSFSTRQHYL